MKRIFALILGLLLCCSSALAHPGGTDSKGGHTNHSTGEYHYHHGYSAHQHENGQCPYDFDDKTGQSSGSASSGSTSSKPRATKQKGVFDMFGAPDTTYITQELIERILTISTLLYPVATIATLALCIIAVRGVNDGMSMGAHVVHWILTLVEVAWFICSINLIDVWVSPWWVIICHIIGTIALSWSCFSLLLCILMFFF